MTWDDWFEVGRRRFGMFDTWWFACPECGLIFQPQHAAEVGVYADYQASLCPKGLGGCGYPQTMGVKLGPRTRYKFYQGDEQVRLGKMVALSKDSGRRARFLVFPFCPDQAIPEDGQPYKLDRQASCR